MSQTDDESGPGKASDETGGEGSGTETVEASESAQGHAPVSKKLTLQDIATDWGCSVPYVSKCKKEGCPVDSLEKARAWREEKQRGGTGFRSKVDGAAPLPAVHENAPKPAVKIPKKKSLATMDASLNASIEIEENCKFLVDRAYAEQKYEKLPLLIQSYNKAKEGRLESEKRLMEIKVRAGELVPWDAARQLFAKGWNTLLSRLRTVPNVVGPKVNPDADVMATELIREELEKAIKDGQATYAKFVA